MPPAPPVDPRPMAPAITTLASGPQQLTAMMQSSEVLMAWFDPQDRLQYANDAFLRAYCIERGQRPTWAQLLRDNYAHKCGVMIATEDFETWLASAQSRRGREAFRAFETDMWDGRWLWMTEAMQPDGSMLCIATDITRLKVSEHAMRHARDQAIIAANTDALTGIGNRRYVLERLDQMLHALQTPADQLSVVVADLDHFKRINDVLGHPAGDEIIRDFATRSQRLLHSCGTVGRVGGEEFMLLLPACCTDQATHLVEQLHVQVRQSRPLTAQVDCRYSFSAGIAGARAGDSLESVFRRADHALYLAKQAGRDRSACATP